MTEAESVANVRRWKRRDIHPETGLMFWAYDRGREWWRPKQEIAAIQERITRKQKLARAANPEKSREETRKWRRMNPDKVRLSNRKKYYSNPEKARMASRRWRESNREKARSYCVKWFAQHPDYARKYVRRKLREDSQFRIKKLLRDRLKAALGGKRPDQGSYGIDALAIEGWFEWLAARGYAPHYKASGVEIDHTIPLDAFADLTRPDAAKVANGWRNLFPMMKAANISKGARIVAEQIRSARKLADEYEWEMRIKAGRRATQ